MSALLTPGRVRILWWISLACCVGAMFLPLSAFTGRPQWGRIQWIPFFDPSGGIEDDAANLLLFLPFGLFLSWGRRHATQVWRVAGCAAALSFCGEFYQVFCPTRYPSVTDILMNTVGALAGCALAMTLRSQYHSN